MLKHLHYQVPVWLSFWPKINDPNNDAEDSGIMVNTPFKLKGAFARLLTCGGFYTVR